MVYTSLSVLYPRVLRPSLTPVRVFRESPLLPQTSSSVSADPASPPAPAPSSADSRAGFRAPLACVGPHASSRRSVGDVISRALHPQRLRTDGPRARPLRRRAGCWGRARKHSASGCVLSIFPFLFSALKTPVLQDTREARAWAPCGCPGRSSAGPPKGPREPRPRRRGRHPRAPQAGRGVGVALSTRYASAASGRLRSHVQGGARRVVTPAPRAPTREMRGPLLGPGPPSAGGGWGEGQSLPVSPPLRDTTLGAHPVGEGLGF